MQDPFVILSDPGSLSPCISSDPGLPCRLVTLKMSELLKNSNGVASSSRSDFVLQEVHVCDICSGPGREDSLAICSKCGDGAEHIYCMRERMYEVPSQDWVCEECQIGIIQIEGRKTVDIEAIAKMNSFGQAGSGSNSRKKKSRAKVSESNRVGKGPTPKILGKRQSAGVEVIQDMQGDRGISAELTSLSSGGRVRHLEETGPNKSQRKCILDLNSPPDDITFSGERLFSPVAEEVKRSDETSAPKVNRSDVAGRDFTFTVPVAAEEVKSSDETSAPKVNRSDVAGGDFSFIVPVAEEVADGDFTFTVPVAEEEGNVVGADGSSANVVGADLTFCGERLFLPVSDEEVKRSGESSGLNLNLEPEEEAAATMGGEDELSLSLSLLFPDAGTTR